MIRARLFRPDRPPADVDFDRWKDLIDGGANLVWVDVVEPSEEEVKRLSRVFELGAPLLDMANRTERRASICLAGDQLGLTVFVVEPDWSDSTLRFNADEVDLLVGPDFVLSLHGRALPFVDAVVERLEWNSRLGHLDSSHLLYVFLDSLMDDYGHTCDEMDDRVEVLEDRLLRESGRQAMDDLVLLRRRTRTFRHVLASLEEPFTTLVAPDSPLYKREEADESLFRLLPSRLGKLVQRLDRIRDLVATSHDLYLANVGHQTNQQLKVLTFLSAILLPMTVITGIFGMNFQVAAMREEGYGWLFYAALAGMALIAGAMLVFFRVRKWL